MKKIVDRNTVDIDTITPDMPVGVINKKGRRGKITYSGDKNWPFSLKLYMKGGYYDVHIVGDSVRELKKKADLSENMYLFDNEAELWNWVTQEIAK